MNEERLVDNVKTEETKALVTVKDGAGTLALRALDYWTSLDTTTVQGQTDFLRCKGPETVDADSVLGQQLSVRDVMIHEALGVDPSTGEEYKWIRYCLILTDGRIVAGGSSGVRNSLADMVSVYGAPPWKGGINCKLVANKTRRGFKVHLLVPA